jgi:hypothetical protein
VYNSSDTTIFLDAILLFRTTLTLHRPPINPPYTCETNAAFRLDPSGVWAHRIVRFPGSGRDYPLLRGTAVVVAVDAVDHREIHPDLQDLRAAQFEFIGGLTDPDNPGAADMVPVTARTTGPGGAVGANTIAGLALPFARDTAELERALIQSTGFEDQLFAVFRIPAVEILDLVSISRTPDREALLGPNCEPFTHSGFDRGPAPLSSDLVFTAISRRSLGFGGNGDELLQRTRSSERDFEAAPPLRRSLRKQ